MVMIATLNIDELINKRKSYRAEIKRVADYCYKCRYSSAKIGRSVRCDTCKHKLSKEKVKGTPPDFK